MTRDLSFAPRTRHFVIIFAPTGLDGGKGIGGEKGKKARIISFFSFFFFSYLLRTFRIYIIIYIYIKYKNIERSIKICVSIYI